MSEPFEPVTFSVNAFHHETGYDRGSIDRWLRGVERMPNGEYLITDILAARLRYVAKQEPVLPDRHAEEQAHCAVLHYRALHEFDWSTGTPERIAR